MNELEPPISFFIFDPRSKAWKCVTPIAANNSKVSQADLLGCMTGR